MKKKINQIPKACMGREKPSAKEFIQSCMSESNGIGCYCLLLLLLPVVGADFFFICHLSVGSKRYFALFQLV